MNFQNVSNRAINKWSPVHLPLQHPLLQPWLSITDISEHCRLQLSRTRAAQQTPLQFPPWSGLVHSSIKELLPPGRGPAGIAQQCPPRRDSPSEWSGQCPICWSPGQRAIGKELQGGSEVLSHTVKVSVRSNEKGRLCFSAWVDNGLWGGPVDFEHVFVKNLVEEMRICSNYPMWLEREKQKWGPWQYFKLWQR